MSATQIIVVWFVAPCFLALLADHPAPLWVTPIGLLVAFYFGARYAAAVPQRIRAAREQRIEAAYQETLHLIEWKPKPRTAVDDIVDALDVEARPEGDGVV